MVVRKQRNWNVVDGVAEVRQGSMSTGEEVGAEIGMKSASEDIADIMMRDIMTKDGMRKDGAMRDGMTMRTAEATGGTDLILVIATDTGGLPEEERYYHAYIPNEARPTSPHRHLQFPISRMWRRTKSEAVKFHNREMTSMAQ